MRQNDVMPTNRITEAILSSLSSFLIASGSSDAPRSMTKKNLVANMFLVFGLSGKKIC